MTQHTIIPSLPSSLGFQTLRMDTDWGKISLNQAKAALSASLCGVSIYDLNDNRLLGMARVIGDGVLNLYIQDVIIDKSCRAQGLGTELMQALIHHLHGKYPADCTIGLMAAKGQTAFYTRFGFIARPTPHVDAGMYAQLGTLNCVN